jgi:CRP-like cAMP-binding protein
MEPLLAYLNAIHPISEGLVNYLIGRLKTKALHKKEYLLKAGHICRQICFIEKGLLRCFYIKDGQEVSSWFMKEEDVIISVESFYNQTPSYESIQALEECELTYIDYTELQYIYHNFPEFNFIGRVLTERYYALSEQRLFSIRMQRAFERYEFLMEHHPELILRVPAKYLASYLGITEVTMSKMKARS